MTPKPAAPARNFVLHPVSGDILLSRAELIGHGVAPDDDFKSGLALALREAFPALYKDFRHWSKTTHPKPGSVWLWRGVGAAGKAVKIACLLTQDRPEHAGGHPGRAKTEHLNHALHELKKLVEAEKIASVALPRLATGVGGLDWKHVEPLLQTQLAGIKVPVFVYTTFQKGVAANESMPAAGQHRG